MASPLLEASNDSCGWVMTAAVNESSKTAIMSVFTFDMSISNPFAAVNTHWKQDHDKINEKLARFVR